MTRFTNSLPTPLITDAVPKIRDRVKRELANLLTDTGSFENIVDDIIQRLFSQSLDSVSASEGTLWLVDEEAGVLLPKYNTGPGASTLIENYEQPLDRGMISTVFVTQRAMSESYVYKNQGHDSSVNQLQGNVTVHMISVPWFVGSDPVGIVSAVKLRQRDEDDPPKFESSSFRVMTDFATLLGEVVEGRIITGILANR